MGETGERLGTSALLQLRDEGERIREILAEELVLFLAGLSADDADVGFRTADFHVAHVVQIFGTHFLGKQEAALQVGLAVLVAVFAELVDQADG